MQNFNEGQEIIYQDLNKISSRMQRFIFDKVLFELMGRNNQGFFQDSFQVSRVGNNEVSVKSGLGFQLNQDQSFDPDMKPISLDSNTSVVIPTANPTDDRIDLIVVQSRLIDGQTESRKFKDAFTDSITSNSAVISKEWGSDIQVVQGTPAASPVKPAVPSGYIEIASVLVEAANGVTQSSNITDERITLPISGFSGGTGNQEYVAVVGDTGELGVTHETLKAALDDPAISSGAKILVTRNETIGTTPEVTKNDIEIVFKPNITFIKGAATKGIIINADGVSLTGARFQDFSTSGDIAIEISSSRKFNIVTRCRFLNCDDTISGATGKNITQQNIEE